MNKKNKIIIAVVAAVVAVAIAVVTVVFFVMNNRSTEPYIGESTSTTRAPTVKYDPEDYTDDICANCEQYIEGKSYYPSDEFMIYRTQDFDKEEIAICEDCAKGMYKDELASGKTLDEFLKK